MPRLTWRLYLGKVSLGYIESRTEFDFRFVNTTSGSLPTIEELTRKSWVGYKLATKQVIEALLPEECRKFVKINRCENGSVVSSEEYSNV